MGYAGRHHRERCTQFAFGLVVSCVALFTTSYTLRYPPLDSKEAMEASEHSEALEYTPTWVLAAVCTVIVFISLLAERGLHFLGKILKHNQQNALYEALQKLKEELMLLGFISLLLTVFQRTINHICVPKSYFFHMLPCNEKSFSHNGKVHHDKGVNHQITQKHRKLLSENEDTDICLSKGKIPLLSIEALEQLHIFIFVLAVVHVVFCATTMILGGAKMSFFKQFHASVTKSDYRALRSGFIMRHCSTNQKFDFHKYMLRTLEDDFKMVVGIRWIIGKLNWYLWLFVVIFLLLNVNGWHTFFWLSFLPLVLAIEFNRGLKSQLLLAVGTKLEQIITCLAQEAAKKPADGHEAPQVKPSDRHFWFGRPGIVLHLIHFILFQNAFGLAIFFWILVSISTTTMLPLQDSFSNINLGIRSAPTDLNPVLWKELVTSSPDLSSGNAHVVIQVLCSYSTLPLYVIVTQMGDMFKQAIFDQQMQTTLHNWAENVRKRKRGKNVGVSSLMNVFTSKRKKDDEADSSQGA
ncbi:hypothetical protein ZIOFF_070266 [Zingiber officinale]|uniref:MLO-like protein n=1 Tax=Zingiber officinale TaxID=94328 RepID=A0A8J5C7K8_ZINOF|nr:hypothetical protein ZIOFF_070266 [Zingiber officinale]